MTTNFTIFVLVWVEEKTISSLKGCRLRSFLKYKTRVEWKSFQHNRLHSLPVDHEKFEKQPSLQVTFQYV